MVFNKEEISLKSLFFMLMALLFGVFVLKLGISDFRDAFNFIHNGVKAEAIVKKYDKYVSYSNSGKGHVSKKTVTFAPIVTFRTEDDVIHTGVAGRIYSNSKDYNIGETVDILYNPSNPKQIRINSFFQTWFATIVESIIGLVFLLVGIIILLLNIVDIKSISKTQKRKIRLKGVF